MNASQDRTAWIAGFLERIPHAAMPTLGGRHFWMDLVVTGTYRIQRNVWTGHCRLLDVRDWRLAAGSFDRCRAAADRIAVPAPRGGTLVVLLHGLYRSRHSLGRLEAGLRSAGWPTIAPNYPSGHDDIATLGAWLNTVLDAVEGHDRVAFVAYSLGGLVVRSALARPAPWQSRLAVAGIVQIGTPNRGARAAGPLRRVTGADRLFGPAAIALGAAIDLPEPPDSIPVVVIAGGTGRSPGFNPFLAGDDDGLVRVAETRLDRDHEFHRVATVHGLLIGHPETVCLVTDTLSRWTAPPTAVAKA